MNIKNPLTADEKEFIISKSLDPDWTDEQIAKAINRSIESVRKVRKRNNITKTSTGVVKTDTLPANAINKSSMSKEQKAACWLKIFRDSDRYQRFSEQLTPSNLKFFAERWADYCVQFDDLKPAEESQLETLITFEIMLADNRRSYKAAQMHEEDLRQMLNGKNEKELDLNNEQDRFIWEMLESNNRVIREVSEEFRNLTAQHEKYFRILNSTREQREQNEHIGADTFLSLVRLLTEVDKRKEVGKYNELMKEATKKELDRLKKPHKFIDGNYDPIILDGKDYYKGKKND